MPTEQENRMMLPGNSSEGLLQYDDRITLNNEVHSRPFITINSPSRCTNIAMLHDSGSLNEEWSHIKSLCQQSGLTISDQPENHLILDFTNFRLKWERHTEFSSYTFIRSGTGKSPFKNNALEVVPDKWLNSLPGRMIVGVHISVIDSVSEEYHCPEELLEIFGTQNIVGSIVSDGGAGIWTDFRLHEDSFSRILVKNINMKERQTGRLLQRLWEIENYRLLALLSLPLANTVGEKTREIEAKLAQNVSKMSDVHDAKTEQRLLEGITKLAAQVEKLSADTSFRFNASKAYYSLVLNRAKNIKEQKIDGIQRISTFMDRRLSPAMRTVESMGKRIAILSQRVNRASNLLQTRINITLQAQNKELLRSMNQRAKLQLRLQQTVEGLSVVAISYYALGIINLIAEAVVKFWPLLEPSLITAVMVPIVVIFVFLSIRRIHKKINKI